MIVQRLRPRCKCQWVFTSRRTDSFRVPVRKRPDVCFKLGKEGTQRRRLECRNADGMVTTAERFYLMGRQSIAFVKDQHAGDIVQVEFLENGNHGGNLHLDIGCAGVHDVEKQIGLM